MASDPVSEALDRLYAGPLDDFLPRRKQLASELRGAGNTAGATAVASAAKPTRTAWALNQIARRQPELLQTLLRAREAAAARSSGDADGIRRAMREYRERIAEVVRAARDLMTESGMELNAIQTRRVTETLQAACAEPGPARDLLVAGRLTRDLDVDDPAAMLSTAAGEATADEDERPPKREQQHAREREQREQRERERERREHQQAISAAQTLVDDLDRASREAMVEARMARTTADRAAREADRATKAAEEAQAKLEAARKALARLKAQPA